MKTMIALAMAFSLAMLGCHNWQITRGGKTYHCESATVVDSPAGDGSYSVQYEGCVEGSK